MRTPGLESVSRAEPTARPRGTGGQDPPGPRGWRPGVQPPSHPRPAWAQGAGGLGCSHLHGQDPPGPRGLEAWGAATSCFVLSVQRASSAARGLLCEPAWPRLRSVQASLASPLLLLSGFCLPAASPPLRKLGLYPHWLLSPVSTGPAS